MGQQIFINAKRTGYGVDQIQKTMTVAELIGWLEQFDDDALVYLKHDNGYTYGGITEWDFEDEMVGEEGECALCGCSFDEADEWEICEDCRKAEGIK